MQNIGSYVANAPSGHILGGTVTGHLNFFLRVLTLRILYAPTSKSSTSPQPLLSFHQSCSCWAALPCCYGDLAVNIPYESHSDKRPAVHRREIDGTFLQQIYSSAAREREEKRKIESELKSSVVFFVTGLVPLLGGD